MAIDEKSKRPRRGLVAGFVTGGAIVAGLGGYLLQRGHDLAGQAGASVPGSPPSPPATLVHADGAPRGAPSDPQRSRVAPPAMPGPWRPPEGATRDSQGRVIHGPQVYDYKSPSKFQAGVPLRPMDIDIFEALAGGKLQRTDLPDLFPNRPYRVRLIGSAEERWITSALIDLDRDGKPEEAWEMKEDTIIRRDIVPGKPAAGTPYALRPGKWLPF
jgi:hypothetical protein